MEDKTICFCKCVTQEEIETAIQAKGYATVNEIQNNLRAGTICGRCIPGIKDILAAHATNTGQQNNLSTEPVHL